MPRRELRFDHWETVREDLRSLATGNQPNGKWNLEQTARHLNDWLTFPMDGFPPAPLPVRLLLALMRMTVGKSLLRKTLEEGKMKDGTPTMPASVYEPGDVDATQSAVDELLRNIDRFENFSGSIHRSPVFGDMDKETAERLQFVHFAHHLSWLEPTETPS